MSSLAPGFGTDNDCHVAAQEADPLVDHRAATPSTPSGVAWVSRPVKGNPRPSSSMERLADAVRHREPD
jgi:hypothetical protein